MTVMVNMPGYYSGKSTFDNVTQVVTLLRLGQSLRIYGSILALYKTGPILVAV